MKNLKLQNLFTRSIAVLYLCCSALTALELRELLPLSLEPVGTAFSGSHPLRAVWRSSWAGGYLEAVLDSLTDFRVVSVKTSGLFGFPLFAAIHMHQKELRFPRLPGRLGSVFRGPLKACPRRMNSGRWEFLSPFHLLGGCCCELP